MPLPDPLEITDSHRNSRWLMQSVLRQISEGIAVADMEGRLVLVNQAFAAVHGYTPDEVLGRHLAVFHTPEQMPAVEAANRQLCETGQFSGEIWHARRDGTVFPILMCNSLLRDESGNAVGMIGRAPDVSERTRAEQALRLNESRLDCARQTR